MGKDRGISPFLSMMTHNQLTMDEGTGTKQYISSQNDPCLCSQQRTRPPRSRRPIRTNHIPVSRLIRFPARFLFNAKVSRFCYGSHVNMTYRKSRSYDLYFQIDQSIADLHLKLQYYLHVTTELQPNEHDKTDTGLDVYTPHVSYTPVYSIKHANNFLQIPSMNSAIHSTDTLLQ